MKEEATQETGEATQKTGESSQETGKPAKKAGLGRWIRSEFTVVAIALLAAVVVFSIPVIHGYVLKVGMIAEYARSHESPNALAEGVRLAAEAETRDQAYTKLQHALSSALTPEARQNALLALGEFLLASARKSPEEFMLSARQYFRITLANDKRPERRMRALAGLLAVARLQADLTEVRSVCAEIHKEKMNDADKLAFLTAQLDAMLALGQWHDVYGLLQEYLPYKTDPRFSAEVTLRWVAVHEQVLNRKDYFAAWRKTLPAISDTATEEELRRGLFTNLLVRLDGISKGVSGRASAEAKFRAFRLVLKDGSYDEAGLRLESLHLQDLGPYEREAALLTIDLARYGNHLRVFQERVLRYVAAYEIDAAIEPSFFETLNLRIDGGKGAEVLSLLEQKLAQTNDSEQRARLLLYMGDLARRLQSDAVAERCYEDILNMPKAAAYHPQVLLARCGICYGRGDLAAACEWLNRYLDRYLKEKEWRDVAAQLIVRLRNRPEKGGADLVSTALILSTRLPNDAITGDFVALVAKQMETLGLTSLAHNYYNRVLLQPVQVPKQALPGPLLETTPATVMLGNARCLLDLNRKMEADRMLRAVCNVQAQSETRSEAALIWAGMALDRDQKRESERRLGLVDSRRSNTNVLWQANVNRMLLHLPSSTTVTSAVTEVMAAMRDPVALEHPELVQKVYQTCFETLTAHNDEAALRMVFSSTNAVLSASVLDAFRLRIAKHYLAGKNYAAAGDWLQRSSLALSSVVNVISKNNEMLRNYR